MQQNGWISCLDQDWEFDYPKSFKIKPKTQTFPKMTKFGAVGFLIAEKTAVNVNLEK